MKTNKAMLRALNRIQHSRGIAVDRSGMFLYSALNRADQGGTASIGASGMLTLSNAAVDTGRMPIGVLLLSSE